MSDSALLLSLIVLMASALGCSPPEGGATPREASGRLVQVNSILISEEDSVFIGDFWTIAVQEDPFRMYVPDRLLHRVAVVDASGDIVKLIGKEGQGPGELYKPRSVALSEGKIVVGDNQRYSVFDTSGVYLDGHNLVDGYEAEDQWSVDHYDGSYYIAATNTNLIREGLRASSGDHVALELDDEFNIEREIGSFIEMYRGGEYLWRFRTLDISRGGIMAIGYYLSPDVQFYDLNRPDAPLLRTVALDHSQFRRVRDPIPITTPIDELQKRAVDLSFVWNTFMVDDSTVVQLFMNRSPEYYTTQSEDEMSFYGMVGTTSGAKRAEIDLPGPIVGSSADGLLYVRMSNQPDKRTIRAYRWVWDE